MIQDRIWINGKYPDGEEAQITIESYPEEGELMLSGCSLSRPIVINISKLQLAIGNISLVNDYNYFPKEVDTAQGPGEA